MVADGWEGLALEASDDGGAWTEIWAESGNHGNSWQSATADLGAYVGGDLELRFVGTTGTTWRGDMAIDNISLNAGETAARGVAPQALDQPRAPVQSASEGISFYPNPVTNHAILIYNSARQARGTLTVYDLSGKMAQERVINLTQGYNEIIVDASKLTNGTYILRLTNSDNALIKRFMVDR